MSNTRPLFLALVLYSLIFPTMHGGDELAARPQDLVVATTGSHYQSIPRYSATLHKVEERSVEETIGH